jgi:chemotaxis protein MotB
MKSDGEKTQEILIIRRGGGDDMAAHKGGAWKIAYADFVTAMMAFFLVMWLINSTNEATRARVASYFNPIKMTDNSTGAKGVRTETPKKSSSPSVEQPPEEKEKQAQGESENGSGTPSPPSEAKPAESDKVLSNPFIAIDAIVAQGNSDVLGSDNMGQRSGDPFMPQAWEALKKGQDANPPVTLRKDTEHDPESMLQGDESAQPSDAEVAAQKPKSESEVASPSEEKSKTQPAKEMPPATSDEDVKALAHELDQAKAELGLSSSIGLRVEVTPEGLLIALEDSSANAMFDVGSAKPKKSLVELISRIGEILSRQEGQVIIRGHTDARKYRSERFDNWQLSTARAHMATYMLERGGLAESRIAKVEGYGASAPIPGEDPMADRNRRVEFVLTPQEK